MAVDQTTDHRWQGKQQGDRPKRGGEIIALSRASEALKQLSTKRTPRSGEAGDLIWVFTKPSSARGEVRLGERLGIGRHKIRSGRKDNYRDYWGDDYESGLGRKHTHFSVKCKKLVWLDK